MEADRGKTVVSYGHEAPLRSVVLRAIDAIAPDTREGLETRLILHLMMVGVLSSEIGRLVQRDFELPGSAALRLVRDFKFTVLVRQPPQPALLRPSKPKGDRRVWLTGQGAKDARKFFGGGGATEGELSKKDMIKRARDTLSDPRRADQREAPPVRRLRGADRRFRVQGPRAWRPMNTQRAAPRAARRSSRHGPRSIKQENERLAGRLPRNVPNPSRDETMRRSAVFFEHAIAHALTGLDAIGPHEIAAAVVLELAARGHRRRTLAGLTVALVVGTGSAILDNVPRPRVGLMMMDKHRHAGRATDTIWLDGKAGAWIARRARGADAREAFFPEAVFLLALAAISKVLGEKVGWWTLRSHAAAGLLSLAGAPEATSVVAQHYVAWRMGGA